MFDKKILESAEYYDCRYSNFATLIIVPVFLLFVFSVIFSIFGKRELTVKVAGQVVPRKVLSIVQSTSSNPIELNNLAEGKKVKLGDVLVTYRDDANLASERLINSQLQQASDRLAALNVYKMSVESNYNRFSQADEFGYSDMFANYAAQEKILQSEFDQQVSEKQSADWQYIQQQDVLQEANERVNDRITQYKAVEDALRKKEVDLTGNPYAYLYDSYVAQVKGLSDDDKNKIYQDMLTTINQSIEQLSETIENNNVQSKSLSKGSDVSKLTMDAKVTELKSNQMMSILKEYANQKAVVDKLEAQLKVLNSEIAETKLLADTAGVIHLLTDKIKTRYLAKGSSVAEIYPDMSSKPAMNVEFMVSNDEVSGIKKGEKIRFRVNKKISKPFLINGIISNVDTSATSTKQGTGFKVMAEIQPTNENYTQLKYGMLGQVVVITGEKTWFDYIKSHVLGG